MAELEFAKLSGAGNDFVAVDNRTGGLDGLLTEEFIRRVCTRGLSVGADGLLELRDDPELDFSMTYYNSDGRPASMCGNGGRCITRFALHAGVVRDTDREVAFRSGAGAHRSVFVGGGAECVRLWMTPARTLFLDRTIELDDGSTWRVSLLDTGVPHAVIEVAEDGTRGLEDLEMAALAPALRHFRFSDGVCGANVDFVSVQDGAIGIRTWERGVEGETLACGTGAVASAMALHALGRTSLPARLRVRSGLELLVGMDEDGTPWLQGEARLVFVGSLREP
ncbi:diaminopimelate epimerase [Candidatus Fermentibacterales bacterium]|nr:diaminopimelate epimerase [Candidatus Fermentibacterales bacterium]